MTATLNQTQAADLEAQLRDAIKSKTHRSLHRLVVSATPRRILIRATAPSYYLVQLAQAAVQKELRRQGDRRPLRLAITVDETLRRKH
jgi:hypothetical protein